MASEVANKTRAHIRYQNKAGGHIPGVSTIVGQLAKPQLIIWANRLGLQGIDSTKYRDEKAEIGSLAHALVMADLRGEKYDTSAYSQQQIDQAETAFLHYLEWQKGHTLETRLVEQSLISEAYQYGGTPDWYGILDGIPTLVDYKTGGIWKEAQIQVAGYNQLILEHQPDTTPPSEWCSRIIILGIPRNSDETFRQVILTEWTAQWEAFKALRQLYDHLKGIKEQ